MDNYRTPIIFLWLLCAITSCDNGPRAPQSYHQDQTQEKILSTNNPQQYILSDIDKQIDIHGSARVIIQLNIQSDKALSPVSITETQDHLILELSKFNYKVIRRYSSLPMMVLEVERATFEYLLHSPLVKSVQSDSISHTMQ